MAPIGSGGRPSGDGHHGDRTGRRRQSTPRWPFGRVPTEAKGICARSVRDSSHRIGGELLKELERIAQFWKAALSIILKTRRPLPTRERETRDADEKLHCHGERKRRGRA